MLKTIGDWTERKLARFVEQSIRDTRAQLPPSIEMNEVEVHEKLIVLDEIELSPQALQYIKDNLPP